MKKLISYANAAALLFATVAVMPISRSVGMAYSQAQPRAETMMADAKADPILNQPYVDADEWRDQPVRHRYVHGGFKGTEARFAFYFPPKELYQGRFFQHVTPAPAGETLDAQNAVVGSGELQQHMLLTLSSGAYFVLTNEGGPAAIAGDQTIVGYRVNAAAAEYSRVIAQQMYGTGRPFGYAFGGSGGCFKTLSGFENTTTWDGAVPFVCGSPMAIPNVFTVRILAMRVLKDKLASVVDAVEPGGSGNIYQNLDDEEQAALREVTRMGFPPAAWFNYKTIGEGAFPVLFPLVKMMDGGYFKDFWTLSGYEGASPTPSLARARVQHATKVARLLPPGGPESKKSFSGVDAAKDAISDSQMIGVQLESIPSKDLEGASLLVKTGASVGKELPVGRVQGDVVFIAKNPFGADNSADVMALKAGDQVALDNSDFLAMQYYHRHQVSGPDFYVWNQFRGSDGKPLEPQRPMIIGPMVTGAGSVQSGRFKGKMIMVESMMDQDALPWQADWYRSKVKEALGEHADDSFRLWYVEHALHSDGARQGDTTHTVSYLPDLYQALRDVSAWVEKGTSPPATTNYKIDDGQVEIPATAAERKGIQPVVTVSANGGQLAEVRVGKPVKLTAVLDVPAGTGRIVSAAWDFEGEGTFSSAQRITEAKSHSSGSKVTLETTHVFSKPGVYFPTLLAKSQRDGDAAMASTCIPNLGRVRVVAK